MQLLDRNCTGLVGWMQARRAKPAARAPTRHETRNDRHLAYRRRGCRPSRVEHSHQGHPRVFPALLHGIDAQSES